MTFSDLADRLRLAKGMERAPFVQHLDRSQPRALPPTGVARDGVSLEEWDRAAAAEAAFFTTDGAVDRADLVVDSSARNSEADPEIDFVIQP